MLPYRQKKDFADVIKVSPLTLILEMGRFSWIIWVGPIVIIRVFRRERQKGQSQREREAMVEVEVGEMWDHEPRNADASRA